MRPRALVVISAALAAAAGSAWGHHSHANYWETEWVSLEGTVQEVHWMNPHTWIYLQVQGADDNAGAWALEGGSAATLRRDGWTPDSIEPGDTLAVRCHPLKDGSRGCLLGFIKMQDGTEKEFD